MILTNMNATLKQIMDLAIASNAAFGGAIAGLFTAGPSVIDRLTTIGDLTEADFPGYSRSAAVNWGTDLRLPDNAWGVEGDRKQFVMNGSAGNGGVIVGGFLVNGIDPTKLLGAGLFDAPIPIAQPGDNVNWSPKLTFDFDSDSSLLPNVDC